MIEEFLNIVNSPFLIQEVVLLNFTVLGEELKIQIKVDTFQNQTKILLFENVTNLNVVPTNYGCSEESSIIMEDLTNAQLENVKFKISISDDAMSFYCWSISVF
jgi:hypothetical protein